MLTSEQESQAQWPGKIYDPNDDPIVKENERNWILKIEKENEELKSALGASVVYILQHPDEDGFQITLLHRIQGLIQKKKP